MATSCPPGMSWDTLVKACVSEEKTPDTGPVKGEGCAAGLFWDSLVRQCMKAQKNLTTEAAPVLEASAETPPGAGAPVVSPLAWGCVLGVMCSSLLALLLWFIIYRKYRRQHARTPADPEAEPPSELQRVGAGGAPPGEEDDQPPTSCPHLNGNGVAAGVQAPRTLADSSPAGEEEEEEEEGRLKVYICNGRKEHGFPLPATELGGAALVTTKTVQCAD
ncbi:uncharacterized protein [Lepisosteus oculatus]|uniref:uncharacterized protein n=1 Tax=Lepisosteus oculatus TaxID=7918 RepID=UPI0035F52177